MTTVGFEKVPHGSHMQWNVDWERVLSTLMGRYNGSLRHIFL